MFSSVPQVRAEVVDFNTGYHRFLPRPFRIHYSYTSLPFDADLPVKLKMSSKRRCITSTVESALLNDLRV